MTFFFLEVSLNLLTLLAQPIHEAFLTPLACLALLSEALQTARLSTNNTLYLSLISHFLTEPGLTGERDAFGFPCCPQAHPHQGQDA